MQVCSCHCNAVHTTEGEGHSKSVWFSLKCFKNDHFWEETLESLNAAVGNSLSYFRLVLSLPPYLLCFYFLPFSKSLLHSPLSLSLHPAGVILLKNTPAVFPCCIFTLCSNLLSNILQPRPRRYARLKRQIAHTKKKGGKNGERRKGQPFTAMQLIAAFDAGGRRCWLL